MLLSTGWRSVGLRGRQNDVLQPNDNYSVRVAIDVCNDELKMDILWASEYLKRTSHYEKLKRWTKNIQKRTEELVTNRILDISIGNVLTLLLPIGIRMLIWAEYHEGTFNFSREYSRDFLNSSLFTRPGIIDSKKAAEALIHGNYLSFEQKFKVACVYCLTDHIPVLYRQITVEDQEKFYNPVPQLIKQPGLVKVWTYYVIGEVNKIIGETSFNQYLFEKAVESGSKAAVEFCYEKSKDDEEVMSHLVDGALEAMRLRTQIKDDWIIFRDHKYDGSKDTWVPTDFYTDIVCFLMSKMNQYDLREFLMKDIEGDKYKEDPLEAYRRSRVLECFISWPYQDYFMKTAEIMWEYLPKTNYAILLLKICDKIEPEKERNLKYCDKNTYDYRELLKKFWYQSPDHFKRHVFKNQLVAYKTYREVKFETGVGLLTKLLSLTNFTQYDKDFIRLILAFTTYKERVNIISSEYWENFCFSLLIEEENELLDWIMQNCFRTKEQANEFQKGLIFTKDAQQFCFDLVKNKDYDTVESYIKWFSLTEVELIKLKKEMVSSEHASQALLSLVQRQKLGSVEKLIEWHLSSEEEVKTFKKELIFSIGGAFKCADLLIEDKLYLVNAFISLCISSEDDIRELKKNIAYRTGSSVIESLISDYTEEDFYCEETLILTGRTTTFKGGKWEKVEKFLTWCFLSEEEISDFKKNVLYKMSGVKIHFNLIKSNRWEVAETFFAWLGLSTDEIKELKKETLFQYDEAGQMFSDLVFSIEDADQRFVDYGSKQEAIELLLRWYLSDKETVLDFNDKFKQLYQDSIEDEAVFKCFNLAIAHRLSDLDIEAMDTKRKSETLLPSKRICNPNE